ncbi:hypothetical protein AMTR_s00023p00202220 [Amborella trichopoda]|uniref:Uncharacterized protein n=1 Tax=Amborella trichopoda TaxID=13333 RepID=W1NKD9_AMBTC|nr:hypothetical protein AMTR_s00023p00202220 [Amborella trichopoda]
MPQSYLVMADRSYLGSFEEVCDSARAVTNFALSSALLALTRTFLEGFQNRRSVTALALSFGTLDTDQNPPGGFPYITDIEQPSIFMQLC